MSLMFFLSANRKFIEMLGTLPALTIWLGTNHQAKHMMSALTAPALTTLVLRIPLYRQHGYQDRASLTKILNEVFPWSGPDGESMGNFLTRRFPSFHRPVFHFCAYIDAEMHPDVRLKRTMEWVLRDRLAETGEDVRERMEVRWLQPEYRPVVYKSNGKAPWKRERSYSEPETEVSDDESDS
ncbi:hypothetical protein B0H19DRAFT_1262392 [Mycena capillaripes]|nr:hypothetical protein B0H19DRAFT_1262392 [Mycena capillaripes]